MIPCKHMRYPFSFLIYDIKGCSREQLTRLSEEFKILGNHTRTQIVNSLILILSGWTDVDNVFISCALCFSRISLIRGDLSNLLESHQWYCPWVALDARGHTQPKKLFDLLARQDSEVESSKEKENAMSRVLQASMLLKRMT